MPAGVLDCVHASLFHNREDNLKQNLITAKLQLCLFQASPQIRD